MRMIPSRPSVNTSSDAERKLFDLFRDVRAGPDACCIHSLRLARHLYKERGELDFVVITPRGMLVIEVKGGNVSRDEDGVWRYRNRYGETFSDRHGPFRQAETGMYSMRKTLLDEFGDMVWTVPVGYAVIFPDCRFDVRTIEWKRDLVLDKTGLMGSPALQHFVDRALEVTCEASPGSTAG